MRENSRPSVKRISEITGFSPATVSNALNMKRGVNRETVERIFEVAEQLGYSVGQKGLKSIKFVIFRRTGQVIDGNSFHPEVIDGVEQEARARGLSTTFVRLDRLEQDYADRVAQLSMDMSGAVILLASEMAREDYADYMGFKCPILLLDGWCDEMAFDGVLINNVESTAQAVKYLISRGHREVGYIGGDFRIHAFREREVGYWRGVVESGLQVDTNQRIFVGTRTESAYEDMLRWLQTSPKLPTAFFADNDLIALGAIRAMTQMGIRVPEDVSVVGFDDLPYSAISNPPLTTIRVDKQAMGREAVRFLMSMIETPRTCHFKHQCSTTFIERESVKTIR